MKHYDIYYVAATMMLNKIIPDTVIDVGLDISNYLDMYATIATNVIGFEPNPTTFKTIHAYVNATYTDGSVVVYPYALSDYNKTDDFFICIPDGAYSVGNAQQRDWLINDKKIFTIDEWEKIEVDYVTLDSLDIIDDIKSLALLKVDTEYNDMTVVFGAINTIKKHRPIIQLEHVYDGNGIFPECSEFMKFMNYKRVIPFFDTDNFYFIPQELEEMETT